MIEVNEIRKRYGGVEAVVDVSFSLAAGEAAGFLGPNGAGKTTTIRMITGSLRPDDGSIAVCGRDVVRHGRLARLAIGYLPESAPVYPEMKPAQFVDFRASLFGYDRRERRRRVGLALDRCRLADVLHRRIGQLSKGYRQRVGLAAAIVHDPPVVILDEPANGLDPTQIREARAIIVELARQRTVLVSSHVLSEIERTCERVLVLVAGRLVADASPAHLAERFAPSGRYHAEVRRAGAEGLAARLRALPQVQAVTQLPMDEGWTRLAIVARADAGDVRTLLAEHCGREGLMPRELGRERATLEEAFAALVEGAGHPQHGAHPHHAGPGPQGGGEPS